MSEVLELVGCLSRANTAGRGTLSGKSSSESKKESDVGTGANQAWVDELQELRLGVRSIGRTGRSKIDDHILGGKKARTKQETCKNKREYSYPTCSCQHKLSLKKN